MLVSVPLYHGQCLVAANPLDRRKIDPGLHKLSDGSVSQGVAHYFGWVESCGHNTPDKRLAHVVCVSRQRCERREEPWCSGWQCCQHPTQQLRDCLRDG